MEIRESREIWAEAAQACMEDGLSFSSEGEFKARERASFCIGPLVSDIWGNEGVNFLKDKKRRFEHREGRAKEGHG